MMISTTNTTLFLRVNISIYRNITSSFVLDRAEQAASSKHLQGNENEIGNVNVFMEKLVSTKGVEMERTYETPARTIE